jgi:hypothetical protein
MDLLDSANKDNNARPEISGDNSILDFFQGLLYEKIITVCDRITKKIDEDLLPFYLRIIAFSEVYR